MKLTEGRAAKVSHLLFKFLAFKNTLPLATDDLSASVSAHVRARMRVCPISYLV